MGICVRERLQIPRGERYELCRSVHAEANAIISASRNEMLGGVLYMTGIEVSTGDYIKNINSCSMCKRLIINAGIQTVVLRKNREEYAKIDVSDWVTNDESKDGVFGY